MQSGRILLSCAVLMTLAFAARAAPDEDLLGKAAGYPIGKPANWFFDESVRVGSFSRLDSFLPYYTLPKAATPLPLPKAANEPKLFCELKGEHNDPLADGERFRAGLEAFLHLIKPQKGTTPEVRVFESR